MVSKPKASNISFANCFALIRRLLGAIRVQEVLNIIRQSKLDENPFLFVLLHTRLSIKLQVANSTVYVAEISLL